MAGTKISAGTSPSPLTGLELIPMYKPSQAGGDKFSGTANMVRSSFFGSKTNDYTLELADAFNGVDVNKATAVNVTVPPNSSVAFPLYTQIPVFQGGAGQITFVAGVGVTINSSSGTLTSPAQYAASVLMKVSTNAWYLFNGSPGQDLSVYALKTTTINGLSLAANRDIPAGLLYKRSGNYYPLVTGTGPTPIAHTANTLRAWPIIVPKGFTFSGFVTEITTNVGASTYRIGIYTDNGSGYPDALVANSDVGNIDSAAAAAIRTSTLAANVTLTPGLYWLALNNTHTPTFRCWTASAQVPIGGTLAISGLAPVVGWSVSLAYAAMPATFTAGATGLSTGTTASAVPIVTALIV